MDTDGQSDGMMQSVDEEDSDGDYEYRYESDEDDNEDDYSEHDEYMQVEEKVRAALTFSNYTPHLLIRCVSYELDASVYRRSCC